MQHARLHLDTHHHVGHIDPRVFGGFLEHLGRAIYEGVYDPASPRSDEQGFRRDVIEALRPLKMPVMRYPGGNFVSCYDWQDGVGPRAARPRRLDYAWGTVETNQFGTDEFMDWCTKVGTAPMMAVNLGTAGTAEAAALLEYCNMPAGTYWADRRRQNGRPAPYDVKLWCLGNEMDGAWQAGHVPAEIYAQRAHQASAMMKGLDPTIETVACGSSGMTMKTYMDWDRTVLEYCWKDVDYISAHHYSENRRDDAAWYLAEGVEIDRMLADYDALLNYVRAVTKSTKRVYLSFDEWNVWYRARAGDAVHGRWSEAPHLLEEHYNLEDALVCAQYLTSFIRHADVVKVACLAQIVNVIAPILTSRDGLLLQTIYHPIAMIAQAAAGLSLVPVVDSPTYTAGARGEVPVLDAAASHDTEAGTVALFLVNRHQREPLDITISLADRPLAKVAGVQVLTGDDLKEANTWEQPRRIVPGDGRAEIDGDGVLHVAVPAPGLTTVRVEVGPYRTARHG